VHCEQQLAPKGPGGWLPVAVVATVPAGTSHAMTQEVTRSGADDVPRALAQRAANNLSRDGTPPAVTPERLSILRPISVPS